MTKQEAHKAIISEVETINFCGHCLCRECKECEKEQAKEEALQALEQEGEANILIIKSLVAMKHEQFENIRKEILAQAASGVVMIPPCFEVEIWHRGRTQNEGQQN